MIEKVKEAVLKVADEDEWKFHLSLVVKYAKHLAKIEKVNMEIVELAALLHDIGRIKFGGKDHEITGVPEAEKILKRLDYSDEIIEEVKHCIESHRAGVNRPAKTKIAEIIRDADAISHFDIIPILIQIGLKKYDGDIRKAVKLVHKKIDRDWNNKMHLPESKRLVEEKYKAAKLLLETTEKCF
ncbi:HD domain-containing protein [Candidatus Woesearchaeota archaeon]|jgi:putative nucleotidyltransferase with HDIG domain|nr:HD domain-containing protein [Candidatus Woesearchaeota archaeon]